DRVREGEGGNAEAGQDGVDRTLAARHDRDPGVAGDGQVDDPGEAYAVAGPAVLDGERLEDLAVHDALDPRDREPGRGADGNVEGQGPGSGAHGVPRAGVAHVRVDERAERHDGVASPEGGDHVVHRDVIGAVVGDADVGARIAGPLVGQLVRVRAA